MHAIRCYQKVTSIELQKQAGTNCARVKDHQVQGDRIRQWPRLLGKWAALSGYASHTGVSSRNHIRDKSQSQIGCLPDGLDLQHVIGVSLIAGRGFTMSTFIATLGFDSQPVHLQSAKSSILVASLISAILGVFYIRCVAATTHNTSLNSTPTIRANWFNR